MKKILLSAVFGCAIIASGAAKADGITLCFANQVSNVALLPQINFVESAVVITNASGSPVLKADSNYGDAIVGSYWTSKLTPQNITLSAGCSTIYFMLKNTAPSTSTQWMCAAPSVSNGPTNAAGVAFSTATGSIGGGVASAAMLIPAIPNAAPATVSGCPSGNN